jgi:hypothetical protein
VENLAGTRTRHLCYPRDLRRPLHEHKFDGATPSRPRMGWSQIKYYILGFHPFTFYLLPFTYSLLYL